MITPPELTDAGRSLLFRAIAGEDIEFTRFSAGNGDGPGNRDVGNPLIHFPITAAAYPEEGYISLTGSFDSEDVESAFRWKELGVLCEDENGDEYLYAYANEGENAGLVTPTGSDALTEQQVTVIIAIGTAEHVTARISASALYASKDDFDDHVADQENPHGVTKAQVGLGNVENYAVNDMPPTYTDAAELTELVSGEPMGTAFGKIKKAVASLIAHINSRTNPHGVTAAQTGAAAAGHTHGAADITAGVLGIVRGGTGGATAEEARASLGAPQLVSGTLGVGTTGGWTEYEVPRDAKIFVVQKGIENEGNALVILTGFGVNGSTTGQAPVYGGEPGARIRVDMLERGKTTRVSLWGIMGTPAEYYNWWYLR